MRLNAEARSRFLAEFPALPAAELARLAGITWSNPAAWASRLQKEGKVFSVEYGRRQLFPAFQFDSDWQPREPAAKVAHSACRRRTTGLVDRALVDGRQWLA